METSHLESTARPEGQSKKLLSGTYVALQTSRPSRLYFRVVCRAFEFPVTYTLPRSSTASALAWSRPSTMLPYRAAQTSSTWAKHKVHVGTPAVKTRTGKNQESKEFERM